MLQRRTQRRLRSVARTATMWLLVVAYSGAALGVPLPVPTVVDGAQSPYPCQAKRCGCRTAEQCWKSCCCHTNRERLAWAVAHGVTPPSYVAVAAAAESKSCTTRPCCAHKQAVKRTPPATPTIETSRTTITWISALDAGRCRGAMPEWNDVPISLPASAISSVPALEPLVCPLRANAASIPFCPQFAPPDPPPRIS